MRKSQEIIYGSDLLEQGCNLGPMVYGSMDPYTYGHEFVTLSAIDKFEGEDSTTQVLLAIVRSFYKTLQTGNPPMFSTERRAELIREGYPHLEETPVVICKPAGVSDDEIGSKTVEMVNALIAYKTNQESGDPDNKLSKIDERFDMNEIVRHMLEVYAESSNTQVSLLRANTELVNALKTWAVVRWMKCRSMAIVKGKRGVADHEHTVDLFDAYLLDENTQRKFVEFEAPHGIISTSSRGLKALVRKRRLDEAKKLAPNKVLEVVSRSIHDVLVEGEVDRKNRTQVRLPGAIVNVLEIGRIFGRAAMDRVTEGGRDFIPAGVFATSKEKRREKKL